MYVCMYVCIAVARLVAEDQCVSTSEFGVKMYSSAGRQGAFCCISSVFSQYSNPSSMGLKVKYAVSPVRFGVAHLGPGQFDM